MWPTLTDLVNAGVIDEQQAQDTLDATNTVENRSFSCPEFYVGSAGTHAAIVRCNLDVDLLDDLDISLPALGDAGVLTDGQATAIYAAFDSIVHCTTRVTT